LARHPGVGGLDQFAARIAANHLTEPTSSSGGVGLHLDRFELLNRLVKQLNCRFELTTLPGDGGTNYPGQGLAIRSLLSLKVAGVPLYLTQDIRPIHGIEGKGEESAGMNVIGMEPQMLNP
jgi:hypothetical protein